MQARFHRNIAASSLAADCNVPQRPPAVIRSFTSIQMVHTHTYLPTYIDWVTSFDSVSFRTWFGSIGIVIRYAELRFQCNRIKNAYIPNLHRYITYIHTNIQTYKHTSIQTYKHTNIQTYKHKHIYTYLPTYLHTYIPTYLHTYIPAYLHTYIPTYLHTYIPAYLHTYIPNLSPLGVWNWSETDYKPHLSLQLWPGGKGEPIIQEIFPQNTTV